MIPYYPFSNWKIESVGNKEWIMETSKKTPKNKQTKKQTNKQTNKSSKCKSSILLNTFVATAPFLYALKTSENL